MVKDDEDRIIRTSFIESEDSLRQNAPTINEFRGIYEKSRQEDKELER